MPVYLAVARTQPPLSGSWGAQLLTPALLPGIENKNIMFPCQRANLTIRPFTPLSIKKKSFRKRGGGHVVFVFQRGCWVMEVDIGTI
jgi:hypothetical protein